MSKAKTQTKTCPRCGKPMEEFAVAWGWECCYDCSVKDARERRKRDADIELRRD